MISIKEYFGSRSGDPPLASSLHGINKECIPNNEKCNRRSNISQMSEENTVNDSSKNNHVDLTHQNDDKLNEKIRSNMKAVIKKHNKYKKRCKSKKCHSSTADPDILDISNVLTNSLTIVSGTSPENIETAELTSASVDDDHKSQVIKHKRSSKIRSRACLSISKELNETYLVVDAVNADLNIVGATCILKAVDHSVKLSADMSIDTVQCTEKIVTYQKNENTEHVQDKSKLSPSKPIFTRRNSDSVNMTKINAFQVMMQARNKIIGSNSPGKGIQDDLSLEDKLAKENLVKRKLMLEAWSEKLGGQKRKVNEILQEEHIKNVMDKRAKRLKKMLTRNKYEKDEKLITSDSNQRTYTKQKQTVNDKDHSAIKKKRHASDSSIEISDIDSLRSCTTRKVFASQDTEHKLNKTIKQKNLGSQSDGIMIKNKTKDPIIESNKTDFINKSVHITSKEAGNKKIKKYAHEMSESKIKNNEQSTFLSKLSSPSKKRDSLLSYFEQINSKSPEILLPDVILDQDENDDTLNKIIKVKFTPKRTQKSYQKTKSLVNNKAKEVNTSKDVSQSDIDNTTHRNTNLKPTKSKSTTPRSSWKMRVKIVSNTEGCLVEEENVESEVVEILDDSADLGVLPTTPKTVQTHKKSLRLIRKHELEQEKLAAAPSVSPIRIDDIRSPKVIHCTKSSNIANKDLDLVRTSSPKSTRNIKLKRSSSEFSSFSKLAPLFIKNVKPLVDKEALKAKETFLKSGVPDVIKRMMEVQKAVEEFELDIFPKISHIQQNCGETYNCSKKLENFNVWNLPVEILNFLPYKTDDTFSYFPTNEVMRLGMFTSCIGLRCQNLEKAAIDNNLTTSLQKQISNYKNLLQIIKQCHPNFPVYKVFRQLKQKNCIQNDTKPNYTNFKNELRFKQINYDEMKTSKCKSLKNNELHKPRLLKKKKISIPVPITKESNAFLSEDSSESIEFIFETEQTCVSNITNRPSNDYLDEVVNENKIEHMSSSCTVDNILWTDKYRPMNSEEIIGNSIAAKTLKDWLTRCKELDNLQTRKTTADADCIDSSDDFTDDSNDSCRLKTMVENTAILIGPVGSGKTSTVYALAGELGFNVLEINASSKRTGKKVLADLQEATQSHHIRGKSDGRIPEMKVKSKKFKTKIRTYSRIQNVSQCTSDAQSIQTEACLKSNRNLSLILVEDINIVFEQDDGFLAALSQIVQTSKRPVIITSSVENHSNLQKLMDNMVIRFHPANPNHISIYMQILCLVENVMVEESKVYELLLLNKGDFRKTLMQLHFWTASGADLKSYKAKSTRQQACGIADKGRNYEHISEVQTSYTSQSVSLLRGLRTDSMDSCKLASDDTSNLSWLEETEMKHKTASKCIEDVVNDKTYINKSLVSTFITTKNYAYLEKLWFIMPNMLVKNNSTNADTKLETIDTTTEDKANQCTSLPIKTTQSPIGDLQKLSSFYENVVFIDMLHSKMDQWQTGSDMSYSSIECCLEVTEYVTEEIKNCADNQMNEDEISRSHWNNRRLYTSEVNKALKYFSEGTSVQLIQHLTSPCDSLLSVTACNPSLTLDYMPYLRNISRAEKNRYETNIKRSNRFYHYLRTLNVNCSNEILDFACNSFLK